MRKPIRFLLRGLTFSFVYSSGDGVYCSSGWTLNSKDCRKLAAWLIKAADYLDHKESRKKGGRT